MHVALFILMCTCVGQHMYFSFSYKIIYIFHKILFGHFLYQFIVATTHLNICTVFQTFTNLFSLSHILLLTILSLVFVWKSLYFDDFHLQDNIRSDFVNNFPSALRSHSIWSQSIYLLKIEVKDKVETFTSSK